MPARPRPRWKCNISVPLFTYLKYNEFCCKIIYLTNNLFVNRLLPNAMNDEHTDTREWKERWMVACVRS